MRAPLRVLTSIGALAAALSLAACLQTDRLTDPSKRPPDPVATDSSAPLGTILGAPLALELGDTVHVALADTNGLKRGALLLVSAIGDTVLWRSDTLSATTTRDTLHFVIRGLPARTPLGSSLRAVAYVEDALGNARYLGAPDSARLRLSSTPGTIATLYAGHSVVLPNNGRVGALASDPVGSTVLFTDSAHNALRGLDAVRAVLTTDHVDLGSLPSLTAVRTVGGASYALVSNSGGTDISFLDITTPGAWHEIARPVTPLTRVTVDTAQYLLGYQPNSLLLYCPAANCTRPTAAIGTAAVAVSGGLNSFAAVRTFSPFVGTPDTTLDVIMPQWSIQGDSAISVRASVIDRTTNQETVRAFRSGISACAMGYLGLATLATTEDAGGPIFAADGPQGQLCPVTTNNGIQSRVLRLEYQFGETVISNQTTFAVTSDERARGIRFIAANADGSRIALVTNKTLYIGDGTSRILGTVGFSGTIEGVTFLRNQRGASTRYCAAVTAKGVHLIDTQRMLTVATLPTRRPLTGGIAFLRTADPATPTVVAPTADHRALVVLPAPLALWTAGAAP